jgi:hypothetical protein
MSKDLRFSLQMAKALGCRVRHNSSRRLIGVIDWHFQRDLTIDDSGKTPPSLTRLLLSLAEEVL